MEKPSQHSTQVECVKPPQKNICDLDRGKNNDKI